MAWTTPKTWSNLDPLVASEFNTQFRDNLNELRADTEDAKSKLGKTFPAYQSPRCWRAVIGVENDFVLTQDIWQVLHANCSLTLTPQTDLALVTVQFTVADAGVIGLGLQQDGSNVSLQETAVISGTAGSTVTLAVATSVNARKLMVSYQCPLPVTRNTPDYTFAHRQTEFGECGRAE